MQTNISRNDLNSLKDISFHLCILFQKHQTLQFEKLPRFKQLLHSQFNSKNFCLFQKLMSLSALSMFEGNECCNFLENRLVPPQKKPKSLCISHVVIQSYQCNFHLGQDRVGISKYKKFMKQNIIFACSIVLN